ncbi:hypothetical protein P168DRAFT_275613 [Aspergillus campestris IBT 28561]|uniref:Uncharacterized protein n=1 Tax=Aspergillus campestris (strain IBT 28561) TaxID=1392248 RepID=A0A2I1CTK1_ASPC2|nr:uncharacterized protein P168DRAFT_275613 [Aspergillus campestris IBT 28561]PKY00960.1 hypothetical protein P168DRAFT_275613 [Aspergillus campestris IBT 28561]
MTTQWSLDFCLVCDRQTMGAPYCTQSCRMAELDITVPKSGESSGPKTHGGSTGARANSTATSLSNAPDQHGKVVFIILLPLRAPCIRCLSSYDNLLTLKSNPSKALTISAPFENELRHYAGCFDQLRHSRRP